MKIEKRQELKIIMIFSIIAIIILLGLYIYFNFKASDNIKFSVDYKNVGTDNVFKYATQEEILNGFEGTSIIFFGFPTCRWCQGYAPVLNELAKENGIDEILYYNIKSDRKNKTEFYNNVVEIVKEYLDTDEEGNLKIYVPDVYFVKNGKIVGHNTDIEQIEEIKELINKVINCSDEHMGC
ncbi:MAG: thioredoxin family protein [Clostridia bacterium]|nr:thioredoxin family protein [Clostridia bacterium]